MRLIKCIIFLFIYLFKSQIEILCLFVAGDRNFKFWIKTNLDLQKFDLNLNLKKKTKLNRVLPHGNHTPSSTGQWKLNENSNFQTIVFMSSVYCSYTYHNHLNHTILTITTSVYGSFILNIFSHNKVLQYQQGIKNNRNYKISTK